MYNILILFGSLYTSSKGLDFGIISVSVGISCVILIDLFYKYGCLSIYPSYYNPFSLFILGGSLGFLISLLVILLNKSSVLKKNIWKIVIKK